MDHTDRTDSPQPFAHAFPAWAEAIVDVLEREFPAAMHHTSSSAADCVVRPRELHPSFYGCFDWHSSVHMQYSGVLLHAVLDDVPPALTAVLGQRLSPTALAVEQDYLTAHPGYEMPYGRAWLMQLAAARPTEPLLALAELSAGHCQSWLSTLSQPIRHGMHANTAFNLFLLLEAAEKLEYSGLAESARAAALRMFGSDRNYPIHWELSGHDFLSNGLSEALLMSRVLPSGSEGSDFERWLDGFLPDRAAALDFLTQVPEVRDPTDGRLAHLFGLALSRAWMLTELADHFGDSAHEHAARLAASAEPQLTDGDFMSTHWLITYALRYQLAATEKTE